MITFALLSVAFLAFAALLIAPKLGALLVWPILFVYPHLYMQRLDLLPWNAGIDDLFICAFFAVVVVRRNLFGGIPLRLGMSLIGALVYFLIWCMAQFSGWHIMPELQGVEVFKPMLKGLIFVLFTYALIHTVDNERDLKHVGIAFVVSLTLAACTVILHKAMPGTFAIFTAERFEAQRRMYGEVQRGVGSLMSPNTGAAILGMAVLYALHLTRLLGTLEKLLMPACVAVMLAGMVLTGSRTGGLALVGALMVMAVLSRARFYAWGLMFLMLCAVAVKPGIFVEYWERLEMVYNPAASGALGETGTSRLGAWKKYVETATPQVWLFGQGQTVGVARVGLNAHSAYVSALFYHGVAGAIWLIWFFGMIAARGLRIVRLKAEPYSSTAAAVLWSLLAWSIAGLTVDMLVTFTAHYTYLLFAVLIERLHHLAPIQQNKRYWVPAIPRRNPAAARWLAT